MDAALHRSTFRHKQRLADDVQKVLRTLKGSCIICYIYDKVLVPAHVPFKGCRDRVDRLRPPATSMFPRQKLPWQWKFIEWKQEHMRFEGMSQYCYGCHVPQRDYLPLDHPSLEDAQKGAKPKCPISDFFSMMMWVVLHHRQLWLRFHRAFNLTDTMTTTEFAQWLLKSSDNPAHFNNETMGVLWLASLYGLVRDPFTYFDDRS